jgi:hypothetical protein
MVGDSFRIATVGKLFNQAVVNTFYYQQTTNNASGASDFSQLFDALDSNIFPPLASCVTADVTWGVAEIRRMVIPPAAPTGEDFDMNRFGGIATPTLPPANCVVIRRKTGFLGRKYRGRIYVPGIPSAWVTNGQLTNATGLIAFDNLAAVLRQPIASGGANPTTFTPVLATLVPGVPPNPATLRVNTIVNTFVDPVLRVQRRREIGVGV